MNESFEGKRTKKGRRDGGGGWLLFLTFLPNICFDLLKWRHSLEQPEILLVVTSVAV